MSTVSDIPFCLTTATVIGVLIWQVSKSGVLGALESGLWPSSPVTVVY